MQRLVCRIPMYQTEGGANLLGKLIVLGLSGAEFRQTTRCLVMSDATRGAIVEYLNLEQHSRMREKDLISVDHIPVRLDNGMRFGDVIAEE